MALRQTEVVRQVLKVVPRWSSDAYQIHSLVICVTQLPLVFIKCRCESNLILHIFRPLYIYVSEFI